MERTLVLIKPDGMRRALAGKILDIFLENGLRLVGMKMIKMDEGMAMRFYEVHKDKPFYRDLVRYICETPIIAMVLEGEDAIRRVRGIIGARDPAKAEPGTIRALYGIDIQRNTVHGSDSEESAKKEIGLIFDGSEIYS
jgi:nucleoside-diphosphate kinase